MSDAKNTTIIPYYEVLARFNAHFFPRGEGLHPCGYFETFEAAQEEMNKLVKLGSYSDVQIMRCDMLYSNGLTRGLSGSKVVKRWHARRAAQ
jgi:hypothetical protein